ncbi:MAG: hypothetical protein A3C50_02960 [Candidatus Staskawiczbacteria bacterium RIFCSPHIGHO2_02_FULL_43_16]|uniref:Uncharacterized protein n=1 Tax=Candidatus Staskawiczbacteria bacterium RIFCSPHIGHO2_01_FULL_41_41 TaxID=1802203 RepID=A0A1G2HRZ8_9BACT|nr:MAG: hypothetical protein A2822_01135 [Candidatus Staskawiczbacteria bacterium RIFCSPHIGHO2_01_FULL_41_41]OGZ68575.1 MAG: hypothetical protein A3C50_02960 [Candidatus Staskawiczbacteria bacterium RIFCSPHIGHO2_02_FULL_43_16]
MGLSLLAVQGNLHECFGTISRGGLFGSHEVSNFMGFFSRKITTDKITESLSGFFDASYGALVFDIKNIDKQILISREQDREIMIVSMFAVVRAVFTIFGDTPITKNIIGGIQYKIFNQYFRDPAEKDQFGNLFWERSNEYSKILSPENKDLDIQFGQIFCSHFFGKEEDGSHLAIMMLVGGLFINTMVEVKKFLNEITSKFTII